MAEIRAPQRPESPRSNGARDAGQRLIRFERQEAEQAARRLRESLWLRRESLEQIGSAERA
eukprot:5007532-Pyramimonas_sp.AAC.1